MIGLFAREGSRHRLLGEVVPFLAGFSLGWIAQPHLGWIGAAVVGLLAWLALSALLLRVRQSPWLRRAWRLALVAHVVFWSWQGMRHAELRPAGAVRLAAEHAVVLPAARIRVGVGDVRFAWDRAPLAGYGARQRRAHVPAFGGLGVLGALSRRLMRGDASDEQPPAVPMFVGGRGADVPVGARALVVLPEGGGPPSLAVVRLDLVVVDEALVEAIRERTRDLRIPREVLLVAASHTHSGPGGCHTSPLAQLVGTDFHQAGLSRGMAAAAEEALRAAVAAARPAQVAFASSRDRGADGIAILARNRRRADPDEIDDRVLALRFDDPEGRILALLLNYAVHPTVLGPDHLEFDRDLVGAVEDALTRRLAGSPPVLFVNGALGDVAPRRGPLRGPEAARVLAERFADRVAGDLAGGVGHPYLGVSASTAVRDLGSPHAFAVIGSRRAFDADVAPSALGDGGQVLANLLVLPLNALPWSLGLSEVRAGFTTDGAAGVTIQLDDLVGRRDREVGALLFEARDVPEGLPATRRVLLWLPGEATQALGKRWRDRVGALGFPPPFLLGLTNGSMAYVTTAEEFDAQAGYEAQATLYGRRTADLVEEALFAALAPLVSSGGGR